VSLKSIQGKEKEEQTSGKCPKRSKNSLENKNSFKVSDEERTRPNNKYLKAKAMTSNM